MAVKRTSVLLTAMVEWWRRAGWVAETSPSASEAAPSPSLCYALPVPLVIPPEFFNAFFGYTLASDPEPMFTTLGFEFAPQLTIQEQNAAALEVGANWSTAMKAVAPQPYTLGPHHFEIGVLNFPNRRIDGAAVDAGSGNTSALPNNSTMLVKKVTNLGGRQGRGRMFVPGASLGGVSDNGTLTPGIRGAFQDAIDEFVTLVALMLDIEQAVLFHDSASPITTPTPLSGLLVDGRIATQRRRMR